MITRTRRESVAAVVLLGAFTLLSFASSAGAQSTSSSSSSSSGEFAAPITGTPTSGTSTPGLTLDSVCGPTLQEAASPTAAETASSTFTQLVQYCQAAQQASKAAKDDGILWKAWAGVAGICTTACITSLMPAGHEILSSVCTYSNIGTAVTAGILTKNFASSLMGLSPLGLKFIQKGNTPPPTSNKDGNTPTPAPTPKKKDYAACLSAATATMQVFTTHSAESSETATMNSNLQSASQLSASNATSSGSTSSTIVTPSTSVTSTASVSGTTANTVEKGPNNLAQGGSRSAQCATVGFACALAMDSNLPGFVTGPGFAGELQKNSGMTPDQYMASNQNPAQSILGASGGAGLNSSGLQSYADLLADAAQQFNGSEPPQSTYVASGGDGGGGGAPAQSDDGLNAAMAGIMKSLNPNGAEKEKDVVAAGEVTFQGDRAPAHSADDRNFSLFDRVSVRYRYVSQRLDR